jgi:hypothetical protein
VASVATLEIEAMIENYGLRLAEGGIDPVLLFSLTQRQQRMGAAASARDLARSIEETISDSLIAAKQKKPGKWRSSPMAAELSLKSPIRP